MLSDDRHAANKSNAAFSTGPRTKPGKARSSRNALSFGLFTLNDFAPENETEHYTKICTSLWTELSPGGTVEEFLTTALISSTQHDSEGGKPPIQLTELQMPQLYPALTTPLRCI